MRTTAENKLWARHVFLIVDDAMGRYFSYEHLFGKNIPLEIQYKISKRKVIQNGYEPVRLETSRARTYMETSRFDEAVISAGLDTEAVRRYFTLVQKTIHLENLLKQHERKTLNYTN